MLGWFTALPAAAEGSALWGPLCPSGRAQRPWPRERTLTSDERPAGGREGIAGKQMGQREWGSQQAVLVKEGHRATSEAEGRKVPRYR